MRREGRPVAEVGGEAAGLVGACLCMRTSPLSWSSARLWRRRRRVAAHDSMRYRACIESRVCTYRARRRDMNPHRESVVLWALVCGGLPWWRSCLLLLLLLLTLADTTTRRTLFLHVPSTTGCLPPLAFAHSSLADTHSQCIIDSRQCIIDGCSTISLRHHMDRTLRA